ncbi:hypothetical protein ACFYSC_08475 [Streptosporangium sp. NPDC004379]|uniref:hypothetical protein n=1 Tax=Streptosporangium sp. NPDC004379 TaxID=3366189 RepID=UPI0036A4D75C
MAGRDLGVSGDTDGGVSGAEDGAGVRPETGVSGAGGAARVGPGVFVRLKLRLIAGGLRGNGTRLAGFVFSAVAAVVVAGFGFFLLAALRGAPADVARDITIILFTMQLLGWAVVPLLAFGLDDTLDPSRLALFPLRTGQLATGMFAASVTGVWPLATLVAAFGAVAGLATGAGGAVVGVVAVLLQFALCIVLSRLITTALSGVLRTRRGRDVLAVSAIFVVLAAQLPNLLVNGGVGGDPLALLGGLASALRWTPSGMAAHAVADGGPAALAELAVLAVLVLVIGRLWIAALRRALVTADASTEAATVRSSRGLLARVLPDGPLAAVATKELKYARRDPRGRVGWFAAVAVTGVLAFSMNNGDAPGSAFLVVGPACIGAVMIALQAVNIFGIDGRSLWMNSVAYGSARDWRTDIAGRQLAVATIAVPLLAVLAVVAALLAGDLSWAVPAALTGWGVLGAGLGVGALTSVLIPYTVPERLNAFTGAAPGQGGVAFAASFGGMIASVVLSLPVVLPVLLGSPWFCVLAVPYGLLVSWGGRRLAGGLAFGRHPEILAATSRAN